MPSTANLGLFIATSSPRTLLGGSDPGLSKATFPEKKRHKVGTTNLVYFFFKSLILLGTKVKHVVSLDFHSRHCFLKENCNSLKNADVLVFKEA